MTPSAARCNVRNTPKAERRDERCSHQDKIAKLEGITRLLERDRIRVPRTIVHEFERIARAHEEVERGADGKVLAGIGHQQEKT